MVEKGGGGPAEPGKGSVLENLDELPALQFAERAGLLDADGVALLRLPLLIVRVELPALLDDLAELGVRHARDGLHDDGLLHLRGHDFADARLADGGGFRLGGGGGSGFAHVGKGAGAYLEAACFLRWLSTVSMRAMSFRFARRRCGFSSCPSCCCRRMLKLSSFSSRRFEWRSSLLRSRS